MEHTANTRARELFGSHGINTSYNAPLTYCAKCNTNRSVAFPVFNSIHTPSHVAHTARILLTFRSHVDFLWHVHFILSAAANTEHLSILDKSILDDRNADEGDESITTWRQRYDLQTLGLNYNGNETRDPCQYTRVGICFYSCTPNTSTHDAQSTHIRVSRMKDFVEYYFICCSLGFDCAKHLFVVYLRARRYRIDLMKVAVFRRKYKRPVLNTYRTSDSEVKLFIHIHTVARLLEPKKREKSEFYIQSAMRRRCTTSYIRSILKLWERNLGLGDKFRTTIASSMASSS